MELNKMVYTIITLSVVVISVAAIMMPVLNAATETDATFTNEGVFNYGVFDTTDTYTLVFDNTSSEGTITVNGTVVTPITGVNTTNQMNYSVLSTDNVLLRYGATSSAYYMQIIGTDANNANQALMLNSTATVTATISNGALSIVYSATEGGTEYTLTFEFNELYAIVANTDEAVLKAASDEVYILGDSDLYASGITQVTAWSDMIHFEGTYNDGLTITSPNTEATFDNVEWNIEEVDGYEDLYLLTSVEFDITVDDTTVHATYSYFAVPTEVTAELSEHLDSGTIALINAIPALVLVSLVMVAVGLSVSKRDD